MEGCLLLQRWEWHMYPTDSFISPLCPHFILGYHTRSGNLFSPFTLGPPVRATTDFGIAQALQHSNDIAMAEEDQGIELEDENEVECPGQCLQCPPFK